METSFEFSVPSLSYLSCCEHFLNEITNGSPLTLSLSFFHSLFLSNKQKQHFNLKNQGKIPDLYFLFEIMILDAMEGNEPSYQCIEMFPKQMICVIPTDESASDPEQVFEL